MERTSPFLTQPRWTFCFSPALLALTLGFIFHSTQCGRKQTKPKHTQDSSQSKNNHQHNCTCYVCNVVLNGFQAWPHSSAQRSHGGYQMSFEEGRLVVLPRVHSEGEEGAGLKGRSKVEVCRLQTTSCGPNLAHHPVF